MYNICDGLMYYMNSKCYEYYFIFVQVIFDFNQGNNIFNFIQYCENDNCYLYFVSINYYCDQDVYVLYFVMVNEMSCESIWFLYDKIRVIFYFEEGQLLLFINWFVFNECDVFIIFIEEFYEG